MADLDQTAALEAAVMAAGPDDAPPVSPMLAPAYPGDDPTGPGPAPDDLGPASEYIPPEVWREQWASLHDMAGGMVQMRSGAPCPLGDQARSAGGMIAADAVYSLLSSTPFLADMFLSARSSFMGQIMAIGLHGFACVQIVRAANAPQAEAVA